MLIINILLSVMSLQTNFSTFCNLLIYSINMLNSLIHYHSLSMLLPYVDDIANNDLFLTWKSLHCLLFFFFFLSLTTMAGSAFLCWTVRFKTCMLVLFCLLEEMSSIIFPLRIMCAVDFWYVTFSKLRKFYFISNRLRVLKSHK